jgi:hypothetical protein
VIGNRSAAVPWVLLLVVSIVGVDVLLLRHQFWPRLLANVGIVLVVGALYLRFGKRP